MEYFNVKDASTEIDNDDYIIFYAASIYTNVILLFLVGLKVLESMWVFMYIYLIEFGFKRKNRSLVPFRIHAHAMYTWAALHNCFIAG